MKQSNFPKRINGRKKNFNAYKSVYKMRKLGKSPLEIERITGLDLSYILQATEEQEKVEARRLE